MMNTGEELLPNTRLKLAARVLKGFRDAPTCGVVEFQL